MKHHATIHFGAVHDDLTLHLKNDQNLSFDMTNWSKHKRQRIAREVMKDSGRSNHDMVSTRSALGAI